MPLDPEKAESMLQEVQDYCYKNHKKIKATMIHPKLFSKIIFKIEEAVQFEQINTSNLIGFGGLESKPEPRPMPELTKSKSESRPKPEAIKIKPGPRPMPKHIESKPESRPKPKEENTFSMPIIEFGSETETSTSTSNRNKRNRGGY